MVAPWPLWRKGAAAGGLILGVGILVWAALPDSEEKIEQAVVSILVTSQGGDWYSPWKQGGTVRASGSGFVISGGLVMTNAHVVSDAKQIIVHRNGNSNPYFAKVAFIGHDTDLAILKVEDESFAREITPLDIGGLPTLLTRVRTYGYPAGGEKISRTEGVISRIEFNAYVHSGSDAHLSIQTDSAINPGNSGGPVLQGTKVVGVAFQANSRLNDVGFFIPTPVIKRFLKDIQDGRYDGYGEMGIVTSSNINPAYREFLGLPKDETGVVVDRVMPGTSGYGVVHPDDVILAIDGVKVENDGTFNYHGHSVGFEQVAEEKQIGEMLSLAVWRNKAMLDVPLKLATYPDGDRMANQFDVLPRYYIYAGLVFMELDKEFLKNFGNFWENAGKSLLYDHFFKRMEHPEDKQQKTVLITRVLPHEVNSPYMNRANAIVDTINGKTIEQLEDVPEALKLNKKEFHVLKLGANGDMLVLARTVADKANGAILESYGIRSDRRF
ncbi:MAG: serine protease [Deltaproteobacteria bacterium]|nr:serine protease [Deltaproteobacteria bacterium]